MESFETRTTGRVFALRLDPGDYLLESINAFIQHKGIQEAYIASAIGTLDYCVLHMVMTTGYPPVEHFEHWEDKPLEVSAISGIIASGTPHLHMVVSDHQKAYSGHVEPGCRVLYLAEIVIAELEPSGLQRVRDEKGILKLTQASQGS
jgi:uncharacterized protein